MDPRILELDRHMTQFDFLLAASRDIVAQTNLQSPISEPYGATVINILQISGSDAQSLYARNAEHVNAFS